jgi:sulfate permease, SulP family
MVVALAQVPALLGVDAGEGDFFEALADLLGELDAVHGATLAVGAASLAALILGRWLVPRLPTTLLVLVLAIAASALLGLDGHGVAVVGDIPSALPDPAIPDVDAADLVALIAPALGVLVLSTEAVGVARSLAVRHGYRVDANRDLVAMGASNALAGLCSGFVQSGGASQTAAADEAGGRSQLAVVVAAALILLTGAFLAPLFADLPQATLGAIVIVAIAGFFDVAGMRRLARIRGSAIGFAGLALTGVLVLGVLEGLIVTAGLSLVYVVQRLSRPDVVALARDPATGAWRRAERHPDWQVPDGVLVVRCEGPLLYPNASAVKDRVVALAGDAAPRAVVLDLGASAELDVQAADTLDELAGELRRRGVELRLAGVRQPALETLRRSGVAARVPIAATIDVAVQEQITPPG